MNDLNYYKFDTIICFSSVLVLCIINIHKAQLENDFCCDYEVTTLLKFTPRPLKTLRNENKHNLAYCYLV